MDVLLRGTFWASLQVLEQVYISQQNVDEDLVNSILWPSEHPNAAESFYQIISGKATPINVLLSKLDKVLSPVSLLLLTCYLILHIPIMMLQGPAGTRALVFESLMINTYSTLCVDLYAACASAVGCG